jgi:hypothetical protein
LAVPAQHNAEDAGMTGTTSVAEAGGVRTRSAASGTGDRLRQALEGYIRRLARARHFAYHPQPRPGDAAAAAAHLAAAEELEPELRSLLQDYTPPGSGEPGAGGAPEDADATRAGRGLRFGFRALPPLGPYIGSGLAPRMGVAGAGPPRRGDRLARRGEVAAAAERYLRLVDRGAALATHPRPLDTDAEAAAGQAAAARRAVRRLREELEALNK